MKTLNLLFLTTTILVSGAAMAQTVPSDPRGETAEQTLDRLEEDTTLEELQEQQSREESAESPKSEAQKLKSMTDSGILAKLPSEANLQKLKAQMQAEPNNLDHTFAYAQMATALGKHQQAAETYEAMLAKEPGLARVKLDLAVSYVQLDRYEDAQALLNEVLQTEPPESVRANIESVLAKVGAELVVHEWGGNITIGVNLDSNGNSAPADDRIVIFDINVPLTAEQRAQQDLQGFVSAGIDHSYKPREWRGEDISVKWDSSVNIYQAEQSSLETLDLKLVSFRTGPNITLPKEAVNIQPYVSHSLISLDEEIYLRNTTAGAEASWQATPQLQVQAGARQEQRDFQNSDTVSTYADRTGTATQASIGARYLVSNNDIVNARLTRRYERTRRDYYDNSQWQGSLGYTRILPMDSFASANTSYKVSAYDDNDALISAKRRHDKETDVGLTVGTKITETITGTIGYQYRNVDSNIPNYDYENHRYSAALSARF